jgi:methylated-DNA-[protein]-cysteine S-methyltransferase
MPARQPEALLQDGLKTPIGAGLLVFDRNGVLRALDWVEHEDRLHRLLRTQYRTVSIASARAPAPMRSSLDAYFAGDVGAIDAIACDTAGTPFQRKVWSALRRIRPGRTLSYSALAARIGMPTAVRAVGHANGSNPISVVIPCHRLIGSDGSLTGYGGGLERKRWLLRHEGALEADDDAPDRATPRPGWGPSSPKSARR